jgi:hypothetical protein
MNYMLLIYGDEKRWDSRSPEQRTATLAAYNSYTKALSDAGVLVRGEPLERTATATTVRNVDGKTQVLDGPFAETKEQLGGFYLLDVADADEALRWAARCPGAETGSIEVRPLMVLPVA